MIPGIVASMRRGERLVFPLTLTNPDAETNTGSTTTDAPIGWTVTQGNLRVRVNEPDREPPQGLSIFDGGTSAESRAQQRIDLVAQGVPATALDAGRFQVEARWWAGTSTSSPLDLPQLNLICLDSSLATISTLTRGLWAPNNVIGAMQWDELIDVFLLPAGTRYIDVQMIANRNAGTDNDAAFDDIRIQLLGVPPNGDPHFDRVVSLLHFDQNLIATFRDQCNVVWTPTGHAQISTAQSKFGGASALFDGSGDYISTTADGFFGVGAGDWTIEFWARPLAVTQNGWSWGIISQRQSDSSSNYSISVHTLQNSTTVSCVVKTGESTAVNASIDMANALTVGQWTHIAFVREGGEMRGYVNGVLTGTTAISGAVNNATAPVRIGAFDNPVSSNSYFHGYIDDLRVTRGVARYTTNFTPPKAAHPDGKFDPYFSDVLLLAGFDGADGAVATTDESSFARTFTFTGNARLDRARQKFGTASLLLNGVGDYLGTPHVVGQFTCKADFTVEAWIYRTETAVGNRDVILSKYASFAVDGFTFQITTGGVLNFALGTSAGFQSVSSAAVIPLNTWTHVAAAKQGSTLRLFINGVNDGTLNVAGTPGDNGVQLFIGKDSIDNTRNFDGYIDELRWTHGVARYISNFTPPALPFPRI